MLLVNTQIIALMCYFGSTTFPGWRKFVQVAQTRGRQTKSRPRQSPGAVQFGTGQHETSPRSVLADPPAPRVTPDQAVRLLREQGNAWFWKLPEVEQNAFLHNLFGRWRIAVTARVVVALVVPSGS